MRLNKISKHILKYSRAEDYMKSVDNDLTNLFLFTQGRVRFGPKVDNTFCENIAGELHTFTTLTTTEADLSVTEIDVTHSLGTTTTLYLVLSQGGKGDLYYSTGSNSTHTYLRSNVTGTFFTICLLK